MYWKVIFFILFFSFFLTSFTQSGKLRLNLDDEGNTYVKALLRSQFWARYIDMNPGTQINGEPVSGDYDFSVRRIRVAISAQLTQKLYVAYELAGNNLNQKNSKGFSLDLFNISAEYTFHKAFAIGFGKNAVQGFSRFNVFSSTTLLTLDGPIFLLSTVNKNDHFGRAMGFWIKGQTDNFDYTFALRQPDLHSENAKISMPTYADGRPRFRTSGYLRYQFFDMESNKSGYGYGTYLGKKKVFNIGIGFLRQAKMMWLLGNNGNISRYDHREYALEFYYDSPLNEKRTKSITMVLGLYESYFGPKYIRNVGVNGYTSEGSSFNGPGSAFPMIGTGKTILFQFGHMFPISNARREQPFQCYYALQYSDFDGLNDPVMVHDVGINAFFKEHLNKLTLGYQHRPIFGEENLKSKEYKGMVVLQYQIVIN